MSVYKRGDIWWYDFTVGKERYRGSTGARLKEDALAIEKREHRKALLGGLHQDIELADAADLWFAQRVAGKKSAATTAHRVEIMLRHMGGRTKVRDIGPDASTSMKLKRAYADLAVELGRVRPGGPAYPAIEACLASIAACHMDLFGMPVKEPAQPFQAQPRPDQVVLDARKPAPDEPERASIAEPGARRR